MKKLILALTLLCGFNSLAQNVPLYTFSYSGAGGGGFDIIDTATWALTSSTTLTSSTGVVDGCNGVAVQPCSGTIYIVYSVLAVRYLGILDPATSVITEIGVLADQVATIAFKSYNQLVGVVGNGGGTPETAFDINLTNATMGLAAAMSTHGDGEVLAYCSDNGFFYRWSGWTGISAPIMEKVDATTYANTNIPLSGYAFQHTAGAVYIGGGNFLCGDVNAGRYFMIDTNGFATGPLGAEDGSRKGLLIPLRWIESDVNTICGAATANFTATAGSAFEWFQDGSTTGITTSTFSATTAGDYHCLITIDSCTYSSNIVTIGAGVPPVVSITPTPDTMLCNGASIVLTGTADVSQQWYVNGTIVGGETTPVITVTTPGLYNILVTNAAGCSDSAAIGTNIYAQPNLVLTPGGTATYCVGDSVLISTTTGGTIYNWYLDGSPIVGAATESIYASVAGTYSVATIFGACYDSTAIGVVVTEDPCDLGIVLVDGNIDSKIYPNPAENYVTVHLNESAANTVIELITVEGKQIVKKVYQQSGLLIVDLDLSDIETGVYLVRITDENGTAIHRLIKR
ncbi:T9SS type A sorting domain-containing protein [Crocinitomix catalasitica]|nr:T9SS type A sorting domain-containing protein [Crocinitomix catalasitica]